MKNIIKKIINEETIMYLIFGILTTLINFISYIILKKIGLSENVSNVLGILISIIFAYIVNKIFVFKNLDFSLSNLKKEILLFFSGRMLTMFLEIGLFALGIKYLKLKDINIFNINIESDLIIKIILNIITIVLNYFISKLGVFKKNKE